MKPRFNTRATLAAVISLGAIPSAYAANRYWDISNASGLTAGNGTWGTSSFWATSATPGTTAPGAYTAGSDVFFQTGGANVVGIVAGGVSALSITQTTNSTATTLSSGGGSVTVTGAAGIVNSGNTAFIINSGLILGSGATTTYVFNAGSTITVGGSISQTGTATINKTGASTLNLNASNSYSGGTTVSAGTLAVGSSSTLGTNVNTNNVGVSAGAILTSAAAANTGNNQTITLTSTAGSLSVLGLGFNGLSNATIAQTDTNGGVIAINAVTGYTTSLASLLTGKNLFVGAIGTSTFTGAAGTIAAGNGSTYRVGGGGGSISFNTTNLFTGANALVVGSTATNGGGTVTLGNAQDYSGGTTVGAGTLAVGASGTLGTNVNTNNVGVGAGTILTLAAAANTGSSQTITLTSTAGSLSVLGLGFNGLPNAAIAQTDTNGGVISINGVTGYSTNLATLLTGKNLFVGASGTSTFTGAAGTIAAGNGSAYRVGGGGGSISFNTTNLFTGANDLVVGSTATNGGGTVTLGAAQNYTGATTVNAGTFKLGNAGAFGDATTHTSGVTIGGSAIFDLAGISPTYNAPLTLNSSANGFDVGAFQNSSATAVTYGGSVTLQQQTRFGGGGSILLTGAITGGGFKFIKDSTGLLELQNSGTVTLGQLQGNRGTVQVDSGTTLNVTSVSVGTGNSVGAGLTLNGGTVNSSGTVTFGAGAGSASGNLTLNSGTFIVPALTKGSLSFNVSFNGGTLKANAASATFFSAATTALVKAGGAFIDDGGFAITVGRALDHDTALGATLDGGLTKSGSGTLTLSGTNTYTGDTTVKAGTLALDSTGSIATSGKIIVGDAGSSGTVLDLTAKSAFTFGSTQTLKGIGTVNIGAGKTVTINGVHAAGNSVGKQTITGNVDYASSTSIFEWELAANVENGTWDHDNNVGTAEVATRGSAFDAVDISGNLAINSSAIFKVILGTDFDGSNAFWTADRSWDVFSVGGTSSTSFTNFQLFNASAPTTEITSATYSPYGSFSYSFGGGTGTLTWSAVPEPTSSLAGLLIAAGLLRRRRSA